MTWPARALHRLVRAYQHLFAGRISPCRFVPSCSSYALDALESHGARRGGWLSVRRLGRCHPWGGHGWDPVPDPLPSSERVRAEPVGPASEPMEHRCSI